MLYLQTTAIIVNNLSQIDQALPTLLSGQIVLHLHANCLDQMSHVMSKAVCCLKLHIQAVYVCYITVPNTSCLVVAISLMLAF